MRKILSIHIAIALSIIVAAQASASTPEWKVDSAHSGIYFRINHIYSTVSGFFSDFEGEIKFDPSNLNKSRFNFKVKVKSVDTNNSKRDGHLLSDEFFDAKNYPEMTFESTAIKHLGGNNYTVAGTMTIKEVSKTVNLPFVFYGFKQHPFNAKLDVAGFEARMAIDRLAYRVGNGKFFKMGVVGKEVEVLISVEATRER